MIRNLLFVFLLIASVATTAQKTNQSPYSFFGIGEGSNPVTVEQSAMGGIGVAYSHYKYLNFTNPAAYANLRFTTYSIGSLNNDLTVKSANASQNSTSTSLSYVALAFPIGLCWPIFLVRLIPPAFFLILRSAHLLFVLT